VASRVRQQLSAWQQWLRSIGVWLDPTVAAPSMLNAKMKKTNVFAFNM
jgi:hypothetical protein